MGVTLYWERVRNLPLKRWRRAMADIRQLLRSLPASQTRLLRADYDPDQPSDEPPCITDDQFRVNCVGGLETVSIARVSRSRFSRGRTTPCGESLLYERAKTNRIEPYDQVAMMCLIVLNHWFGNAFQVASDAPFDQWPVATVHDVLGFGAAFELYPMWAQDASCAQLDAVEVCSTFLMGLWRGDGAVARMAKHALFDARVLAQVFELVSGLVHHLDDDTPADDGAARPGSHGVLKKAKLCE